MVPDGLAIDAGRLNEIPIRVLLPFGLIVILGQDAQSYGMFARIDGVFGEVLGETVEDGGRLVQGLLGLMPLAANLVDPGRVDVGGPPLESDGRFGALVLPERGQKA
jgi:hypothetical protein